MSGFAENALGIRRGEWARSLLLFAYAFVLLTAYLILKPVRNSLFLDKFDASELVFMYMIIAIFAAVVVSAYTRIGARLKFNRFVAATTIFIIANLIAFWWLITQQYDWLVYVFYIWVSLFGVITTSQFWLLANHIFDAREAKRLFPFIGSGAITGGLFGSKITNLFAQSLGTESLLWVCIGAMVVMLVLLTAVWPLRSDGASRKQRPHRTGDNSSGAWPLIFKSRYLRLLTMTIGLTVMVSTFVDFQFNWVVQEHFPTKDARTAFFGDFFFYLSLVSLALQLTISSRILNRFGVGAGILVLPFGLLLGSIAVFLWPLLIWSAVTVKLSDGAFRYSIHKSGSELLYLPVAAHLKSRVKGLMDVVGDRFARGIGGALLFVATNVLAWSIGEISIISVVLICVWVGLGLVLRQEYVAEFRDALKRHTIDTDQIRVQLRGPRVIEILSRAINNPDPSEALFALGLSAGTRDKRLRQPLLDLQLHTDPRVRLEAIRQLRQFSDSEMPISIYPFIIDEDPDVRLEAIRYICEHVPPDDERGVKSLLDAEDPVFRSAVLRCEFEQSASSKRTATIEFTKEALEELLRTPGTDGVLVRRHLAAGAGFVQPPHPLADRLELLLKDSEVSVKCHALESVGRAKRMDLLADVVAALGDRSLRDAARTSLVLYGSEIVERLGATCLSNTTPLPVGRHIPKAIALIGGDKAARILTESLVTVDVQLKPQVIKALGTLRRRESDSSFNQSLVRSEIQRQVRLNVFYCVGLESAALSNANRWEAFLRRALKDKRRHHLEMTFRLLGLLYPQRDIISAYHRICGAPRERAAAIEFLDTFMNRRDKELLFPLLESPVTVARTAAGRHGIEPVSRVDFLLALIDGADPWLAACAARVGVESDTPDVKERLTALRESDYRPLQEVARGNGALD